MGHVTSRHVQRLLNLTVSSAAMVSVVQAARTERKWDGSWDKDLRKRRTLGKEHREKTSKLAVTKSMKSMDVVPLSLARRSIDRQQLGPLELGARSSSLKLPRLLLLLLQWRTGLFLTHMSAIMYRLPVSFFSSHTHPAKRKTSMDSWLPGCLAPRLFVLARSATGCCRWCRTKRQLRTMEQKPNRIATDQHWWVNVPNGYRWHVKVVHTVTIIIIIILVLQDMGRGIRSSICVPTYLRGLYICYYILLIIIGYGCGSRRPSAPSVECTVCTQLRSAIATYLGTYFSPGRMSGSCRNPEMVSTIGWDAGGNR